MNMAIVLDGDWRSHVNEGVPLGGMKMLGLVTIDGIEGALSYHWSLDRYLMVTRNAVNLDLKVLPREAVAALMFEAGWTPGDKKSCAAGAAC